MLTDTVSDRATRLFAARSLEAHHLSGAILQYLWISDKKFRKQVAIQYVHTQSLRYNTPWNQVVAIQ